MYIEKCSEKQIKELMSIYATYTEINIAKRNTYVEVEVIVDGIPEQYILNDYNVEVYDWDDSGTEYLKEYRKKMLQYFGVEYAINYLVEG